MKKFLYWGIVRPIFYVILRFLYPYKIINKKRTDDSYPSVIVCNHLSNADSFMVGTCFNKKIFFLCKKEWFKNKLVGGFLRLIGGVPIDRENTDLNAIKECFKVLKDGNNLGIFPEGTRNKTDNLLLPFKNGVGMIALRSKVTVIPLFIYKKPKMFRKNYICVGEKFSLEEFYGIRDKSVYDLATEKIRDNLLKTKIELDEFVDKKKNRKGNVK